METSNRRGSVGDHQHQTLNGDYATVQQHSVPT
jgi:hypothetical protein